MDLKKLQVLNEQRNILLDSANAIDGFLLLDYDSIRIFKANGIGLKDLYNFVNPLVVNKVSPVMSLYVTDVYNTINFNQEYVDTMFKILSISKYDLSFIISKNDVYKKMLNVKRNNDIFRRLLYKLEDFIKSNLKTVTFGNQETKVEYDDIFVEKINRCMDLLNQILNMVSEDIGIEIKGYGNFDFTQMLKEENIPSIDADENRTILFGDMGAVVVFNNSLLDTLVNGNSDIAIKLYEDLLVGYKNNKAIYYSQIFAKYIVS